eukprot:scaffold80876_cov75-Phaeocystis_antarctica.AAC.4
MRSAASFAIAAACLALVAGSIFVSKSIATCWPFSSSSMRTSLSHSGASVDAESLMSNCLATSRPASSSSMSTSVLYRGASAVAGSRSSMLAAIDRVAWAAWERRATSLSLKRSNAAGRNLANTPEAASLTTLSESSSRRMTALTTSSPWSVGIGRQTSMRSAATLTVGSSSRSHFMSMTSRNGSSVRGFKRHNFARVRMAPSRTWASSWLAAAISVGLVLSISSAAWSRNSHASSAVERTSLSLCIRCATTLGASAMRLFRSSFVKTSHATAPTSLLSSANRATRALPYGSSADGSSLASPCKAAFRTEGSSWLTLEASNDACWLSARGGTLARISSAASRTVASSSLSAASMICGAAASRLAGGSMPNTRSAAARTAHSAWFTDLISAGWCSASLSGSSLQSTSATFEGNAHSSEPSCAAKTAAWLAIMTGSNLASKSSADACTVVDPLVKQSITRLSRSADTSDNA